MLGALSGNAASGAHNVSMTKVSTRFKQGQPRHFIRQWRRYRRLTQEQLAERISVTHGALSQLERGIINYTQPMLEAVADALDCTPGDLITRDPLNSNEMWSVIDTLNALAPEQRSSVISIIETLRKAS